MLSNAIALLRVAADAASSLLAIDCAESCLPLDDLANLRSAVRIHRLALESLDLDHVEPVLLMLPAGAHGRLVVAVQAAAAELTGADVAGTRFVLEALIPFAESCAPTSVETRYVLTPGVALEVSA